MTALLRSLDWERAVVLRWTNHFSRRLVAAVDVLDVSERNTGAFLPRVIEIEGVARQEDEVTVEILGDRRTVGGDEAIEGFFVLRRDPARELKFGRVPVPLEPVFVGEPYPEHVEL